MEGNSGTVDAVFTVTLSGATARMVTVNRATANNTAVAPGDYTALSSATLTFPAGTTTQQVIVQVIGDTVGENDETFNLNLSAPVNATIADTQGVGTITNDDGPSLQINNASVGEGQTGTRNLTFTVTLTPDTADTVTVSYATANGTALAPADYTATTGSLTFAPHVVTRTLTVPVVGDTLDEDNETFSVVLSNPVNAALGVATGTGTITDDDVSQMSISDATVAEGDTGTTAASLQVTLAAAAARTVTVEYANVAGGTATAGQDFEALSGTLTFPPGTTTKTVTVNVLGDVVDESDETVLVRLSNAPGVTLVDSQGQLTIIDDEALPTLSVDDPSVVEGNSGTSTLTFTVTLNPASGRQVTVAAATVGGTAAAGSDYTATNGTLTFPAGATQRTMGVPVLGDTTLETDEVVLLGLSSPVNATLSNAQGRGLIQNDEAGSLGRRELSHGVSRRDLLEPGASPENWYSLLQAPWTSHEIVVDEVSGRVSAGSGPIVELVDASGLVKAGSAPVGTGSVRSLRVLNATASWAGEDVIRVRSASCTTDCGAGDGYRVRAYQTTYSIPRFNNGGSQMTVLVLQNTSSETVGGTLMFWSSAGALLGTSDFSIAAHSTLVLNTSTLSVVAGKSGSVTVANDGHYGDLAGKSIALEPATGFSFDSPMEARIR